MPPMELPPSWKTGPDGPGPHVKKVMEDAGTHRLKKKMAGATPIRSGGRPTYN